MVTIQMSFEKAMQLSFVKAYSLTSDNFCSRI